MVIVPGVMLAMSSCRHFPVVKTDRVQKLYSQLDVKYYECRCTDNAFTSEEF